MTTRVSTNFCKRIRQLFTRQRKVNYHPIEEAVREYIEAGNTDIHALAQAMNVLPLDLYFMVSSDDLRVHLVDSLPKPHRDELTRQLRDRVYKSHPVQFANDYYGKLKLCSVDELSCDIARLRCWMGIHSDWQTVKLSLKMPSPQRARSQFTFFSGLTVKVNTYISLGGLLA